MSTHAELGLVLSVVINLLTAIGLLVAGWVIGNYVSKIIHAIKKLDKTLKTFLGGLAKYAIFALSILMILQQFGVQTASLIAVLGAAGLAIGLALQGTLSNVAAGVMLLILRPFNVGDYIVCGDVGGTVESLGLFASELATPDNVYIFVPNSQLWNADIQNFSRNKFRRIDIVMSISYGDDIDKAFKTIEKVVTQDERILKSGDKVPQIMVSDLGDASVNVTARIWCHRDHYWNVKYDMTKIIKEALDKAGLNIAFQTRMLVMSETKPDKEKTKTKKKAA